MVGTVGQPAVGRTVDLNNSGCLGYWCFGGVRVVAVEKDPIDEGLPTVFALGAPFPNPTAGKVMFALGLPRAAEVRISVLDVEGRSVGSMRAGSLDAGRYRLEWDGTDGNGRVSPAGVYFARLLVDGRPVAQRRIVRLR
ncbi:MAG TPA: FlgD immunoglobulin-like domain containing protein [Candidatus Eisenbacteria bacterium]|nr:FlgD immunoglobulin-like domain containing protein [Candidatus Eisenbacteria bacterium]